MKPSSLTPTDKIKLAGDLDGLKPFKNQKPSDEAQREAVLASVTGSAKCATCKLFDRAFPQNHQLGYCKGIQIQRLDGGGIAIARRIYAWLPGDESLRLMDDFGCAYHSPNS